jgi:hypothetical protein
VDPRLLVAMMAVESSFNPIAESNMGAKGLMQIIPKYHLEKFTAFGGEQSVFNPQVNISVGARILREYLKLHSGDLFAALQMYAGAGEDNDALYTHRVLDEKDRLDSLAGLPKTNRKQEKIVTVGPEQAVPLPKPVIPLVLKTHPAAEDAGTDAPLLKPIAAMPGESAKPAHAPPGATDAPAATPISAPAPAPAKPAQTPVNLTLAEPESARF